MIKNKKSFVKNNIWLSKPKLSLQCRTEAGRSSIDVTFVFMRKITLDNVLDTGHSDYRKITNAVYNFLLKAQAIIDINLHPRNIGFQES